VTPVGAVHVPEDVKISVEGAAEAMLTARLNPTKDDRMNVRIKATDAPRLKATFIVKK
jgi:hypothetical protein